MIPLRSATHHIDGFEWGVAKSLYHRLLRLSSQQGRHLYHLHQIVALLETDVFTILIRPHLKWKKITWTITEGLNSFRYKRLADVIKPRLLAISFPAFCQEVNLELELAGSEISQSMLVTSIEQCRRIELRKEDGSKLAYTGTTKYSWLSSKEQLFDYDDENQSSASESSIYEVLRLAWSSGVPKREYTSFDRVRCLEESLAEGTVRTI